MKSTTGAEATAFSMACFVWSESSRCWNLERKGDEMGLEMEAGWRERGRAAAVTCRKVCGCVSVC